ncbi:MAG: hypothetical protein KBT48_05360, partial [Firmicutes bacterium]|nr:hypothetical protein [Bacillota bacterium]
FYIIVFAMGGSKESESSTTIDDTKYPEVIEEKKIENPLMKLTVQEETVYSGSGEDIGSRAYIRLSEKDFNKLEDSQIAEFVLSTVKKYEDQKYNYFTIDFGNERGVVFPGCNTLAGHYGQIDDTGSIELTEKFLMVSDSGEVSWEEVSKEELDEQKQEIEEERRAEQEKLAQERQEKYDNEIVYVSQRGIYHSRSNCSNMKYFTEMTRKEAIECGYERCEKC